MKPLANTIFRVVNGFKAKLYIPLHVFHSKAWGIHFYKNKVFTSTTHI